MIIRRIVAEYRKTCNRLDGEDSYIDGPKQIQSEKNGAERRSVPGAASTLWGCKKGETTIATLFHRISSDSDICTGVCFFSVLERAEWQHRSESNILVMAHSSRRAKETSTLE